MNILRQHVAQNNLPKHFMNFFKTQVIVFTTHVRMMIASCCSSEILGFKIPKSYDSVKTRKIVLT